MKKIGTILVLLFVLSCSVFAEEGQIPIGGKSCPQGQQTCLANEDEFPIDGKAENPIYLEILDFLKSIFE